MSHSAAESARALGPVVVAHRNETETDRRLAQPIVDRLIEERLCRMFLVHELGGHPASPVEALEAYEILAGFEASVPWIAWNNSLVCGASRFLADSAREELFRDPSWLYAQSTRPSGTAVACGGGYRVSGHWQLVSGCELAEWLLLLCVVEPNGGPSSSEPETRFTFVRRGDYEVLDTWHVGGLRGTGSHDVVVRDVFVPGEHCLSLGGDVSPLAPPIDRAPIIVNLVAAFAAQALGVARTSVDFIVETGKTKHTPGPMPSLRDREGAQTGIALHSAAVAAARAHLHACVSRLWDQTVAGETYGPDDLGDVYAGALHADSVARDAVDAMYALGGTSSLYTESVLERAHRDIHAMLRHIVAQPAIAADAGRVRFGLEPTNPQYAI